MPATFHVDAPADRDLLIGALGHYEGNGLPSLFRRLLTEVRLGAPKPVQAFFDAIGRTRRALTEARVIADEIELYPEHAPLLREALLFRRRQLATDVYARSTLVHGRELRSALDEQLAPHERLMGRWWLRQAPPVALPALVDYFPTSVLENLLVDRAVVNFDDKFNILYAASGFHHDLEWARQAHELRGLSLAVAYLDIDNFKNVNTTLGEPTVDRVVLPQFQRCIEAHVYMRGRAFKIGGDEYIVMLQNVDTAEACQSMRALQQKLAAITYAGVGKITASIGVVLVSPRCPFIGAEIEGKAAAAKALAKASGKNVVATYTDEWLSMPSLIEQTKENG